MTPSEEVGEGKCFDGIDNDLDGLTDCADPSCRLDAPCAQPAPALSPVFLALGVMLLVFAGLVRLRRRFE